MDRCGPDVVEVRPLGMAARKLDPKPRVLTIMVATHGNEPIGLALLTELFESLLDGAWHLGVPLTLVIGNREAAEKGVRFVDCDLNRSFGASEDSGLYERRRARELEPILAQSRFLLDIHQTILPNTDPFFIFPYSRAAFALCRTLAPFQPVVTHWNQGFSAEGLCTDEFVNRHHGVGFTLETGQAGFATYQLGYGLYLLRRLIEAIARRPDPKDWRGEGGEFTNLEQGRGFGGVFTWSHVEPLGSERQVELVPGLYNFQRIEKDQVLGRERLSPSGTHRELQSPSSGWLLFPKYVPEGLPKHKRPSELYRLLRSVEPQQLPAG